MSEREGIVQRTLVVGLGQRGAEVGEALATLLQCRHGELPVVEILALRPFWQPDGHAEEEAGEAAEPSKDDQVMAITFPLPRSRTGRAEARTAFWQNVDAVERALVAALVRSSQTKNRYQLRQQGLKLTRLDEVAVYIVVPLEEAEVSGFFIDLAYLLGELIQHCLNSQCATTGLLLLPPLPSEGEESEILEGKIEGEVYASLRELDHFMGPHDGFLTPSTTRRKLERWGPPFNHACCLIGPLNEDGLTLESPETLMTTLAESLYHMILSSVGEAWDWLELPFVADRERYASFGLASLIWPGQTVAEVLGQRWVREFIGTLLLGEPEEEAKEALEFLNEFAPHHLTKERLAPAEMRAGLRVDENAFDSPSPLHLAARREEIDNVFEELEREWKAKQRARQTNREEALERWQEVCWAAMLKALDAPPIGGPIRAEALWQGLKAAVGEWQQGLEEKARGREEHLLTIKAELERVGTELDQLAATFPFGDVGRILSLLHHLVGLFSLFSAYRRFNKVQKQYLRLRQRYLETTVTMTLENEALEFYQQGTTVLEEQGKRVRHFRRELEGLLDRLTDEISYPELDEPSAGMSLASEPLLEELYEEEVMQPIEEANTFLAQQGPLSCWLEEEWEREDIARVLNAWGRERTAGPASLSVGDVLERYHPQKEELLEGLEEFLQASKPFWQYDEAALTEEEREGLRQLVVIGVGNQPESLLPDLWTEAMESPRFVSTGDHQRLIAMTFKRGLPLRALAGLEGYHLAYEEHQAEELHSEPDFGQLPDPADEGCLSKRWEGGRRDEAL